MKYRVTFMERTDGSANPSENPTEYVAIEVSDGVIRDKAFVERIEPAGTHNENSMEEDDDFLSVGSETWEYDIAGGREKEFLDALKNSQMAIECVALDDEPS